MMYIKDIKIINAIFMHILNVNFFIYYLMV